VQSFFSEPGTVCIGWSMLIDCMTHNRKKSLSCLKANADLSRRPRRATAKYCFGVRKLLPIYPEGRALYKVPFFFEISFCMPHLLSHPLSVIRRT
jgi:hypothetical protein